MACRASFTETTAAQAIKEPWFFSETIWTCGSSKLGDCSRWMWKITAECQQVFDQPRTHLENWDNSLPLWVIFRCIFSQDWLWLGCQWPPEGVKISPRNNPFVFVKLEHGGAPWLKNTQNQGHLRTFKDWTFSSPASIGFGHVPVPNEPPNGPQIWSLT